MKNFIVSLLIILFPVLVLAVTGDTLYVQANTVNMREGPSTTHPVIMKLHKGHKLIEISRRGSWVEVGAERTNGKIGWIHSSLVGEKHSDGSTTAPETPEFKRFESAFNQLNAKIRRSTGYNFFTKSENLGDGIVQVTATDVWLSAPLADRKSNLRTIYDMWDAAEKSDLPIAVYVVDEYGNQRMSLGR